MADEHQLAVLRQGVDAWNAWREQNSHVRPDLRQADLSCADLCRANLGSASLRGANLYRTNLCRTNLSQAILFDANLIDADLREAQLGGAFLVGQNLRGAQLSGADLSQAQLGGADLYSAQLGGANLSRAHLSGADLSGADLSGADVTQASLLSVTLIGAYLTDADLRGARLGGANLGGAHLTGADLRGADLTGASLVHTNLTRAKLIGCRVYGISAWDVELTGAKQENLIITPPSHPEITTDNLEVAQFIYLLLHNEKIRHVIDTITSKVVLILGRFTEERKAVLDALREELRRRDYLPVLFDFDKPAGRSITETVSLLARMAHFVVADITDARSIPQELGVIVPDLPSVPVQPLLLAGAGEYGMFEHYRGYRSVLETYVYGSPDELIANLVERVIGPAEVKVRELRPLPLVAE